MAARYAELVEDKDLRRRVFDKIVAEHDRTIAMHQLITGHEDLLADNPALARSVFNRFSYLEPSTTSRSSYCDGTAPAIKPSWFSAA
ncbi:phosphoenolpyruvate carboxylase [Mycobacteroides chelonae]|nr:phosphoenolpyruvate carboxylase [Mycobacteroides chelonae]